MDPDTPIESAPLSLFRAVLSFVLVGLSWGLTTPFIRRAAVSFSPTPRAILQDPSISWVRFKIYKAFFTVLDLLQTPAYLLPLVINLTGSVWFFLLIGKAGKLGLGLGPSPSLLSMSLPFYSLC
jgi:hypothetical protein